MTAIIYPFIVLSGALQAIGNALNAQLRQRLSNPWLAAAVSFVPIFGVLTLLVLARPTPLPTAAGLKGLHWYDAFGGVAGCVAVLGGLVLVDKVGSGPFNGLTITGNILMSLALDAFGLLGLHATGLRLLPWLGGLIMIAGVTAITLGGKIKADREKQEGGSLWAQLLYPFILVAGALQAVGAAVNAELRHALVNPWLAADVSFLPVLLIFVVLFVVRPRPLPEPAKVEGIAWWLPLGGMAGALAVFAGLLFIDKVGAGVFNGLLITTNLVASLVLDHFGWLGMNKTPTGKLRFVGALVTIAGILVISVAKTH